MIRGLLYALFGRKPEKQALDLAMQQRELNREKRNLVETEAYRKAAEKSLKDKSDARATDPEIASSFLM